MKKDVVFTVTCNVAAVRNRAWYTGNHGSVEVRRCELLVERFREEPLAIDRTSIAHRVKVERSLRLRKTFYLDDTRVIVAGYGYWMVSRDVSVCRAVVS